MWGELRPFERRAALQVTHMPMAAATNIAPGLTRPACFAAGMVFGTQGPALMRTPRAILCCWSGPPRCCHCCAQQLIAGHLLPPFTCSAAGVGSPYAKLTFLYSIGGGKGGITGKKVCEEGWHKRGSGAGCSLEGRACLGALQLNHVLVEGREGLHAR